MASAGSKERARAEEAFHPASAVLGVTVKPSRISHASAVLRRNELSVEDCARLLAARSVSPAAAARLLTTLCDASACATHEIETRVDAQNVCHDCGAWAVVLEGFYNCLDIGADSGGCSLTAADCDSGRLCGHYFSNAYSLLTYGVQA